MSSQWFVSVDWSRAHSDMSTQNHSARAAGHSPNEKVKLLITADVHKNLWPSMWESVNYCGHLLKGTQAKIGVGHMGGSTLVTINLVWEHESS